MSRRLQTSLSMMVWLGLMSIGCGRQDTGSAPVVAPQGGSAIGAAQAVRTSDANAEEQTHDMEKETTDEKTDATVDLEAAARKFITQLANEQFAEATKDTPMRAATVRQTWTNFVGEVGMLKDQGQVTQRKVDNIDVISVTCTFERAPIDIIISFSSEHQVIAMSMQSAEPIPDPNNP